MSNDTLLQTSVRGLVAFCLRSGDLGSSFVSAQRTIEGTRGHQYVQDQRPPEYRSEVSVRYRVDDAHSEMTLEIVGRVDGVLQEGDELLVEEIKSTYSSLEEVRPDNLHHWAQAKIYAHILVEQLQPTRVEIQLTYVQLDSGELREDRREFTREELEIFFLDMTQRYLRWARIWHVWCDQRDASIDTLPFPFPTFRPGQHELSEAVFETVVSRGRLFAQAPTGIGKTVSVLFPAIRALGEGEVEKIFYLTAKTSGRTIAEKTLQDMRDGGLRLKSCTITARDRICFNARDGKPCDAETCEFALGYYDRINDAVEDTFASRDDFTRTSIEEAARKHQVCPFELGLDLSLWSDVLICDFNYVFDPKAYLRRYFLETGGNYGFLVDEAHNLVDRARDMYSAQIRRSQVRSVIRDLGKDLPALRHVLGTLDHYFKTQIQRCQDEGSGDGWLDRNPPDDLQPLLQRVQAAIEPVLARNRPTSWKETLTDLFFTIVAFLRVYDLFDEHYVTYGEKRGRGDLILRLYCLDPSSRIREACKRGRSVTFFSATLTPVDYFRRLLGGEHADYTLELDSPFPPENLLVMMADHIDTSYRGRGQSYDDVAKSIAAAVGGRRGNYMVYFPSYKYLQEVLPRFEAVAARNTLVMMQVPRMNERQKEQFLNVFNVANPETVVGFAVMGGIFGEGIDLVGERLVGAIVVGVGLPQIGLERDLIKGYYDDHENAGFAYAYTYPGMNRVLQAAGRVIRSEADRGLLLLIDKRFSREDYVELYLPSWGTPKRTRNVEEIGEAVDVFWESP
ncbi:MAG: helicase C-terminal domain-containing protein [Candidatus Latescibacterota bacterium]|nr:helicase C-terminal domain-containing protein [Candidatus Latescibacterota bacterium]